MAEIREWKQRFATGYGRGTRPSRNSRESLRKFLCALRSMEWGNGQVAIVEEERWKDRKRIMLAVSPAAPGREVKLFEGSFEDHYHDPGQPFEVMNTAGKLILRTTRGWKRCLLARGGSLCLKETSRLCR